MKYQKYEKVEVPNESVTFNPDKILMNRKIDLNDLSNSTFDEDLRRIPKEREKELNETGKTIFSIIKTVTIVIEK